jgi:hypothetical protein
MDRPGIHAGWPPRTPYQCAEDSGDDYGDGGNHRRSWRGKAAGAAPSGGTPLKATGSVHWERHDS